MRSPFENKSLIEWMERQPKGSGFQWNSPQHCALCQYFRAMGFSVNFVTPEFWEDEKGTRHKLPKNWNEVVMVDGQAFEFHLYSDIAKRARKILVEA